MDQTTASVQLAKEKNCKRNFFKKINRTSRTDLTPQGVVQNPSPKVLVLLGIRRKDPIPRTKDSDEILRIKFRVQHSSKTE